MNIQPKHIASRKRIGTLDGKPVVEAVTTGGLWLVVTQKSDGVYTLGTGPHRAVARYIARKREPKLEITELSKSEDLLESAILSVAPKYEALTDEIAALMTEGM